MKILALTNNEMKLIKEALILTTLKYNEELKKEHGWSKCVCSQKIYDMNKIIDKIH